MASTIDGMNPTKNKIELSRAIFSISGDKIKSNRSLKIQFLQIVETTDYELVLQLEVHSVSWLI